MTARKTKSQKVKSAQNRISYKFENDFTSSNSSGKERTPSGNYLDVKKIIIVSIAIITSNIAIYLLLTLSSFRLGFLGY